MKKFSIAAMLATASTAALAAIASISTTNSGRVKPDTITKVEAGGVEIKAVTLTELEFEDAGEAEIFFLPVKPGKYRFYAKGLEGKGMLVYFVVK